jgi:hypothetical protein
MQAGQTDRYTRLSFGSPWPVKKIWMMLPGAAGLSGLFRLESWFSTTARVLSEPTANTPGAPHPVKAQLP